MDYPLELVNPAWAVPAILVLLASIAWKLTREDDDENED